jgi:hypothetical protein
MEGLLAVVGDAELDDAEDQQDEQREYERELDRGCTALTLAMPKAPARMERPRRGLETGSHHHPLRT